MKRTARWILYTCLFIGLSSTVFADDSAINWGVTTFFKVLQEGGLIKVQELVQKSYQSYDAHPSRNKLDQVAALDMTAGVFIQYLPDEDTNKAFYLKNYWKDENIIRRINEKLSAYIKSVNERGELMLSWRKKTIDAMDLYYREHSREK